MKHSSALKKLKMVQYIIKRQFESSQTVASRPEQCHFDMYCGIDMKCTNSSLHGLHMYKANIYFGDWTFCCQSETFQEFGCTAMTVNFKVNLLHKIHYLMMFDVPMGTVRIA